MPVLEISASSFEKEVAASPVPVLMDFYATWCGPCRMVAPIVEEIAAETPGLRVVKVNVDEEPELANRFGVSSIPTLVVVRDGKPYRTAVGLRPKADILAMIFGEGK